MQDTRFIVVRHGETAWNAESRIQGHLDSPLNEEGLAQALLVGERLARERIDALYCSDLGRVRQTIQPPPMLCPSIARRWIGIGQAS